MLEQLRALLAHFGEIADPRASQFAHVPAELWDDLKAKVADPGDDPHAGVVSAALTNAEQSVRTAAGLVAVQLQAGDLAALHEVVAAVSPPPEAVPAPTEGEAPTENPSEGDPPPSPLV